MAGIAAAGVAAVVFGWRSRESRPRVRPGAAGGALACCC
jgi:hypothetical protein